MKKNLGWKEILDQNIWKYDLSLKKVFFIHFFKILTSIEIPWIGILPEVEEDFVFLQS